MQLFVMALFRLYYIKCYVMVISLQNLTMGHGFGNLYKIRGIVMYRLSPFEMKAFGGVISHGIPNTFRRIKEEFFYVVPRE